MSIAPLYSASGRMLVSLALGMCVCMCVIRLVVRCAVQDAAIAPLGERETEDLKVTGSIPVGGNSFVINIIPLIFSDVASNIYWRNTALEHSDLMIAFTSQGRLVTATIHFSSHIQDHQGRVTK